MKYYEPPNPHSFGDTGKMYRIQKQEKEDFKRKEMQEELKREDRESEKI